MRILFLDTTHPFLTEALVRDGHECIEGYEMSSEEILTAIQSAEGIVIRSRIFLNREVLEQAKKLRFIARAGAGMESIDTVCAGERDIACISSPEGNRNAVGEHAIGMLLALFNKLCIADRQVREGKWARESNRGIELNGKVVGLIGYGNMGSAFASRLSGFGCEVLAYDKYKSGFGSKMVKETDMNEIFNRADILSLHVPLTSETEYLVDRSFIDRFRKNICIINTARGKCIRTDDLVESMKSGKLTGVCLDVIEYEDISFEKFSIDAIESNPSWQYLVRSEKAVLTPHIAGWTYESLELIARVLYEKISAFIQRRQ